MFYSLTFIANNDIININVFVIFNLLNMEGDKMIKTIKLSYKHKVSLSSAIVSTFFKTAGIHVIENRYGEPINLQEEFNIFKINTTDSLVAIDAEVILTDCLDDDQLNKSLANLDYSVKINCGELMGEQGYIDEEKLINEVLNQLSQRRLLSEQQESYLRELAEVIISEDYIRTSLFSAHGFVLDSERKQLVIERIEPFVKKVKKLKNDNNENIHAKYALLSAAFEANRLSRGSRVPMIYSPFEIEKIANEIIGVAGGVLDREIQILRYQNYHTASDRTESYYTINETLRNENSFNPLAYRFKAQYWMSEEDWERAIIWFKKAISLYPEDYKSWNGLGFCLFNIAGATVDRAHDAFSTSIKILEKKRDVCSLTPGEVFYLYEANYMSGKIMDAKAKWARAMHYYSNAKRTIETLNGSHFVNYLNLKNNDENKIEFANLPKKEVKEEDLGKRIKKCKAYLGV